MQEGVGKISRSKLFNLTLSGCFFLWKDSERKTSKIKKSKCQFYEGFLDG